MGFYLFDILLNKGFELKWLDLKKIEAKYVSLLKSDEKYCEGELLKYNEVIAFLSL